MLLPLLAGLGLTEFSMAPAAIPLAKQASAGCRIEETQGGRPRVEGATATDVERTLADFLSPASGRTNTHLPLRHDCEMSEKE